MIKHRDKQYKHELRKREQEQQRLKDRLSKAMADRNRESKAGIDILNNLKGKRGRWGAAGKGSAKAEEELFQQTVNAYEERMNELVAENNALRKSLSELAHELQEALNSQHQRLAEHNRGVHRSATTNAATGGSGSGGDAQLSEELQEALDEFTPAQFELPFALVRGNIEDGMRAKLHMLREKIQEANEAAERAARDSVKTTLSTEEWLEQVRNLKAIIAEQDQLLRSPLYSQDAADKAKQDGSGESLEEESRRWSSAADAEAERNMLRKARREATQSQKALERERLQLARDRKLLEAEKEQWRQMAFASQKDGSLSSPAVTGRESFDLTPPTPMGAAYSSEANEGRGLWVTPAKPRTNNDMSAITSPTIDLNVNDDGDHDDDGGVNSSGVSNESNE
eukprot:TRINITY_DN17760_c0_g1_i1.p1 TRINITY_DN17760_c0_g1~~TRINITY_DN17760_c0_g1_i1.p1  ORF type:complete len:430 (+),score=233.83 TRINITY_DN17760_c0_g1_i1:101-1291(+)